MKHINRYSFNDRVNILNKFDLHIMPEKKDLCVGITDFVYRTCEIFIPDKLKEVFRDRGLLEEFRNDIKNHLEFNTWLLQLEDKNQFAKPNFRSIKEIREVLNEMCKDSKFGVYLNPPQDYQKKLLGSVHQDLGLDIEKINNTSINPKANKLVDNVQIPIFAEAFVLFAALNYDLHGDYQKNVVSSTEFIIDRIQIYNRMAKLYPDFENISLYLFEKEYNFSLINGILNKLPQFSDINKVNVRKVLSLATLLPNVRGRFKYVISLCEAVSEMKYSFQEDGFGGYGVTFDSWFETSSSKEMIWIERVIPILLKMIVIAVPLMEILHYHLACIYNFTPNIKPYFDQFRPNLNEHSKEEIQFTIKCINSVTSIYKKNKINNFIRDLQFEINGEKYDDIYRIPIDFVEFQTDNIIAKAIELFQKEYISLLSL